MEIANRIKNSKGALGKYADIGKDYFMFPKLTGPISNRMGFQGKECIIWSVNNYMGLANDPEVRLFDEECTREFGLAHPMGARMMTGNTDLHEQLETDLSQYVQKESTLLLNYGYQGMVSIVDALLRRNDLVLYDSECHACIMDGIRMHPGPRLSFRHNDMVDFEQKLIRGQEISQKNDGGILVITEGVFGMGGDQGRIREICAFKKTIPFLLLVDDAHGFGVMGADGSGTGTAQDCQQDIDLFFGTFAKALASVGGFVSGDEAIINYLRYNLRSQIFAKSLPSVIVASNMKRLQLVMNGNHRREQLWQNALTLQKGLRKAGFNLGKVSSVITPVYMNGALDKALLMGRSLREDHGIFCSIVVYPVVPKGDILFRLIPTSLHTREDVSVTIQAFESVAIRILNTGIPSSVEK